MSMRKITLYAPFPLKGARKRGKCKIAIHPSGLIKLIGDNFFYFLRCRFIFKYFFNGIAQSSA
jgi:hypothetical protein